MDIEKMVFKLDWWLRHKIHVPPISEQKNIAVILSTWDNGLKQIETLITNLKARKQGFLQQLTTVATGVPEFNGTWEVHYLEEVATVNALTLAESTDLNFAFIYVDITAVKGGQIELPFKPIKFAEAPSRARRRFREGDMLLWTVRPNLGGHAYVDFPVQDCVCSTGFAVITPKPPNSGRFLYQLLFTDEIRRQCFACVTGSSYPAMSESDVKRLKYVVLSPKAQIRIAEILSAADDEIQALEKERLILQKQKLGLMQKLLTAEVRVRV